MISFLVIYSSNGNGKWAEPSLRFKKNSATLMQLPSVNALHFTTAIKISEGRTDSERAFPLFLCVLASFPC